MALEQQLADGKSIGAIARSLGKSQSSVSYWVKKHGLTSPLAGRHAARGGIKRERLERLVESNLSVRQIAAELGTSATTVRHWLRRFELETTTNARRAAGREPLEARCIVHGVSAFVRTLEGQVCSRCRAEAVARWRQRAKAQLVAEAGGQCALCGYDRCVAALHFHHRDPSTKLFGLGSRGLSRAMATLREEAAKCVLLCATCHAEVEVGVAELPFAVARPITGS